MDPEKELQQRYALLVKRHLKVIRLLCWHYSGGDLFLCSEFTQEIFADLWKNISALDPSRGAWSQRHWVLARCRSVFSHWRRSQKLQLVPLKAGFDVPMEETDNELHEVVMELSEGLSPREREVLDCLLEDLSIGEIARRLGIKPQSVSHIRQCIIKKMRTNYKKRYQ